MLLFAPGGAVFPPLISPVQGERARAAEYNDRAGKYKPDDPSYLRNKLYFAAQGS